MLLRESWGSDRSWRSYGESLRGSYQLIFTKDCGLNLFIQVHYQRIEVSLVPNHSRAVTQFC